jgi:lysyl-tRNA synthetase class 2
MKRIASAFIINNKRYYSLKLIDQIKLNSEESTIKYFEKKSDWLSLSQFQQRFNKIEGSSNESVSVTGRIKSIRSSGKYLHFIDISQDFNHLQLMINDKISPNLSNCIKDLRKGDIIEGRGYAGKSQRGELTCFIKDVKRLVKCQVNLPDEKIGINNLDFRTNNRHLDLIANPESVNIFKMRSKVKIFSNLSIIFL